MDRAVFVFFLTLPWSVEHPMVQQNSWTRIQAEAIFVYSLMCCTLALWVGKVQTFMYIFIY